MIVSEIALFNTLKAKLGEHEAQVVVEGIRHAVKEEFDNKKDALLVKQDKIELIEKMNRDKQDILKWMFGFWITLVMMIPSTFFMK